MLCAWMPAKGKGRNLHRHQSLLNAGRNLQFFLMLARLVLDGRQLRIVHQGRGLPRDRPHQIMVNVGEAARLKVAFQIQRPEYLAAGGIFGALAMARLPGSPQRNADDGVNAACDDALRNLTLRSQCIRYDELVRAAGRLPHHRARYGGSVGQHFACRIPAKSHFQRAIGARQEDVSALHLGQRQRGLQQRRQHPVHLSRAVELPRSLQKPPQLFQVRVLRADALQLGEDVRSGGCLLVFGRKPQLRRIEGPELNSVSRPERAAGYLLAIHKCSVPALCVLKDELRAIVRDRSVAARDIGLRKRQVALRGAPNHKRKPVDDDSPAARTIDEFHGERLRL
jgi:hypothetical protein